MQIEAKKVYYIGNVQFDSEHKARAWIYDQIGNLMDKALSDQGAGAIGPKERIQIVNAMTKNAAQFAILLSTMSNKAIDLQ